MWRRNLAIVGKAAIQRVLESVVKELGTGRMESLTLACHDIEVSGTLATEWCTEQQVVTLANGTRFNGQGKMLLVLHQGGDGHWRIKKMTLTRLRTDVQ